MRTVDPKYIPIFFELDYSGECERTHPDREIEEEVVSRFGIYSIKIKACQDQINVIKRNILAKSRKSSFIRYILKEEKSLKN